MDQPVDRRLAAVARCLLQLDPRLAGVDQIALLHAPAAQARLGIGMVGRLADFGDDTIVDLLAGALVTGVALAQADEQLLAAQVPQTGILRRAVHALVARPVTGARHQPPSARPSRIAA